MIRASLLMLLFLFFTSCESDYEGPSQDTITERIRSVQWLTGDTLLAALVTIDTNGAPHGTNLRIYHRDGVVRREFFLTTDEHASSLHITSNGQTAIFNANGNVELLDLATEVTMIVSQNTSIRSYDPEKDMCILSRREDNPNQSSPQFFAIAAVSNSALVIKTTLQALTAQSDFPMFLSNGRIATMESDGAGNLTLTIRDSILAVTRQFNLPRGILLLNPLAPRDTMGLFYASITVSPTAVVTSINRIRTDNGFIDELQSMIGVPNLFYADFYTVFNSGKKIVTNDNVAGSSCIVKDITSGTETTIAGTQSITRMYISNDDRSLAIIGFTSGGDKLSVVPLP